MEEKEASNLKLDPNDGMKEALEMEEEKTGIDSITNCTFWGHRENGNLQKAMIHTVDHQAVYHLILWSESQRVGVDDHGFLQIAMMLMVMMMMMLMLNPTTLLLI